MSGDKTESGANRKRGPGRAACGLIVVALVTAADVGAAPELYVGGLIGWGVTPVDRGELDDRLDDADLNGKTTDVKSGRFGASLLLGYRLSPVWSVEGALTHLGEIDVDFRDLDAGTDASDLRDVRPGSGYGVELAAVAGYDFRPDRRGFVRFGAFDWRAEYDYEGSSDTATGLDPLVGLGMAWTVRPDWAVHATWTRYTVDDDATHLFGLGLRYRFGGS